MICHCRQSVTGGWLPLVSSRPVVIFPAAVPRCLLANTKLYCLVTEDYVLHLLEVWPWASEQSHFRDVRHRVRMTVELQASWRLFAKSKLLLSADLVLFLLRFVFLSQNQPHWCWKKCEKNTHTSTRTKRYCTFINCACKILAYL